MFSYLNRRGQSTLEYAVLIAVVVGALLAIQVYVKRGVQGRFKQAADDIGEQFSPGYSGYNYTTTSLSSSHEESTSALQNATGSAMSTTTSNVGQNQTKVGTEYIRNATNEYWGQ